VQEGRLLAGGVGDKAVVRDECPYASFAVYHLESLSDQQVDTVFVERDSMRCRWRIEIIGADGEHSKISQTSK